MNEKPAVNVIGEAAEVFFYFAKDGGFMELDEKLRKRLSLHDLRQIFDKMVKPAIKRVRELDRAHDEPAVVSDDLKKKMNSLMYFLVKGAARQSFAEFLEELNISDDEYEEIKLEWEKIGITRTYC